MGAASSTLPRRSMWRVPTAASGGTFQKTPPLPPLTQEPPRGTSFWLTLSSQNLRELRHEAVWSLMECDQFKAHMVSYHTEAKPLTSPSYAQHFGNRNPVKSDIVHTETTPCKGQTIVWNDYSNKWCVLFQLCCLGLWFVLELQTVYRI